MLAPHTGWLVIDEFAGRFVFFYSGYILATHIFAFAAAAQERPRLAAGLLVAWAILNGVFVFGGLADLPVVSLALGAVGAAAVVAVSALMARSDLFAALRYLGRNSIVVYLAFFLGMAASRAVLLKTGLELGTVALLVTKWAFRRARLVLGGAPHAAAFPVERRLGQPGTPAEIRAAARRMSRDAVWTRRPLTPSPCVAKRSGERVG